MPTVRMTEASLLDGSFYDWMYAENDYGGIYKPEGLEQWAVETNRWVVHYVAGMLAVDCNAKVLDLGSGMGHYIRAWKDAGFSDVTGIEISKVAIDKSAEEGIVHGSIADMHMFEDNQFDLVFSASVLEHIPDSVLDAALSEVLRVGRNHGHLIGIEVGTDPTHVTILKPDEWAERFSRITDDPILLVGEPVFREFPVIFSTDAELAPRPFRKMFHDILDGVLQ